MQVNSKLLLNSAENILKSRHEEGTSKKRATYNKGLDSRQVSIGSAHVSFVESRMLKLQSELKTLQEKYSHEQMREDFLHNKPQEISSSLDHNNNSLFPEHGNVDLKTLSNRVDTNMKQLLRNLKAVQIEMENLYALNFEKLENQSLNIERWDTSFTTKDLDPQRVAYLTRS